MRPLTLPCLIAALVAWQVPAGAQESKLVTAPHQEWTTALAGTRATLEFSVRAGAGFKGRLIWTLAEVKSQRVLPGCRGESALAAGGKGTATAKVVLAFPDVNPGAVLKARLTVSLVEEGTGTAVATLAKTIHLFYPNPFAGRTNVLRDLHIVLYDPDPAGKTGAALKGLQVPFEEEKNLDALADRKNGVVVVGEGVSFQEDPGLADVLLKLARRGLTVICLAPTAGSLPFPGADQDGGEDVSLFRRDIIRKLDKRLDVGAWGAGGKVISSTLAVKAGEGSVVAEVTGGVGGWPWLQVDYPQEKGRLIVCGFALLAHWQANPTPRYLFARMIESAIPSEAEPPAR
jgi:hypothetical protein